MIFGDIIVTLFEIVGVVDIVAAIAMGDSIGIIFNVCGRDGNGNGNFSIGNDVCVGVGDFGGGVDVGGGGGGGGGIGGAICKILLGSITGTGGNAIGRAADITDGIAGNNVKDGTLLFGESIPALLSPLEDVDRPRTVKLLLRR
jgi:hypothetical protein